MRNINFRKFPLVLLAFSLLATATFGPENSGSSANFLTAQTGYNISHAQTSPDCSEYMGNASINEVRRQGNKEYFIEVKIINDIDNSRIENWSISISSDEGKHSVNLDKNNADWSSYPWIIVPEESIPSQKYIDLKNGMEILLEDGSGKDIDYLSIAGYSDNLSRECADLPYDNTMESTNSHTIMRDPDGTGDWKDAGPGNSRDPTRGGENKGDEPTGDFDAVEVDENAGGPLYTKISGKEFKIDILYLSSGNGQGGGKNKFQGKVDIDLVDPTRGVDCNSFAKLKDLGTKNFGNKKRLTVGGLTYNNAIGRARIRITGDKKNNPAQGCSTDTFTIRPAYLLLHATDNNWILPGEDRALDGNNNGVCKAANGNQTCHKAGRPFTLQGSAYNDNGNRISLGYIANASINLPQWEPNSGTKGNLNLAGQVSFDGSKFGPVDSTYTEVGLIDLNIDDNGTFSEQSGDRNLSHCVPGESSNTQNNQGKYGCRTASLQNLRVGRFVPDHFRIEPLSNNTAYFRNFCTTFTYLGQPFYYLDGPGIELTAENAQNQTANNYGGEFWKFTQNNHLGERRYLDRANATAYLNATLQENATLSGDSDFDGSGNFTLPQYNDDTTQGDEFRYLKNQTEKPFHANATLVLHRSDLTDRDGVCYARNGNCSNYTIQNITGTELRYGRAVAENAHGSELLPLRDIQLRAEYYREGNFQLNLEDGCTDYNASKIDWSSADYDVDEDLLPEDLDSSGYGTLEQGAGNYTIHGKGSTEQGPGETGYADYRFPVPAWLKYDWNENGTASYPPARATFGIYKGSEHIIYQQETTWK